MLFLVLQLHKNVDREQGAWQFYKECLDYVNKLKQQTLVLLA